MLKKRGADIPSGGVYGVLGPGCDAWLAAWTGRDLYIVQSLRSSGSLCTVLHSVPAGQHRSWADLGDTVQKDGDRDGGQGSASIYHIIIIIQCFTPVV